LTVTYNTVAGANGYELDASTASDLSGTILSTTTTNASLSTLTYTAGTLAANTIYYARIGAIGNGTTSYVQTVPFIHQHADEPCDRSADLSNLQYQHDRKLGAIYRGLGDQHGGRV